MTEPPQPNVDVWVGRATPRPVDPYTEPIEPYVLPVQVPPGYVLVPEAPRRRTGLRVFLIVAGIFAACCAGGATLALLTNASFRDLSTPGTTLPEANPQPSTVVKPDTPGLNTPVRDGKFEFVVSAVTCGQKSVGTIVKQKAKGDYCIVDLSVRNIGTEKQLMLDAVQKAYDADGTAYSADTGAGVIASTGTNLSVNLINPGNLVTGKIVYDVPKGAQLAKLELHDSALSLGTTVTV